MNEVKLLGRQNDQKYKISEKYSVEFYTLAGYAIFRYFEKKEYMKWEIGRDSMLGRLSEGKQKKLFDFEVEKKEYGTWEIGRDSMLGRLSSEESKKLSDFEAEKKEKYKKYEVYIM